MSNYRGRIIEKIFQKRKDIYQKYLVMRSENKKILFNVGCQRSGTTLMIQILERDMNAKVYGEFSVLSNHDKEKIRLNPLAKVKSDIDKNAVQFIVLKPLVESQNIVRLLDFFTGSRAVWIFRGYRDVAASNLKHFGIENGINNLRPIVNGEKNNWRFEGVSTHTKEIVKHLFSEKMLPHDAAALFWYVRNVLYFELDLQSRKDILLCRYEDLVTNPAATIKKVYSFVGVNYPGDKIVASVHNKSIDKGKSIYLSAEVEELCTSLMERLLNRYLEID